MAVERRESENSNEFRCGNGVDLRGGCGRLGRAAFYSGALKIVTAAAILSGCGAFYSLYGLVAGNKTAVSF